jgi:hypothetical protein
MRRLSDSILMKRQLLLVPIALLASLVLRAQTSTPSTTAGQSSAGSPQSAQPATPPKLEDDPAFQKLTPEMQEHVRKFDQMLREALANEKNAPAKETAQPIKGPDNPATAPTYHYANAQANNAPAPNAQPAKPAAPSPCAVAPKKPGFFDKLKQHAKQTLEKQAGKADAQIGKASKGNVDGGVQDATTTAVNQANQPDPCTPAKGKSSKQ